MSLSAVHLAIYTNEWREGWSVSYLLAPFYFVVLLLRGTIVDRTCGLHKNLYIQPFLLTVFGPINYGPP